VVHDEHDGSTPVDLALADVLGDMPQKTFASSRVQPALAPLRLPAGLKMRAALERVLRLLSVGSKRFLTTKVDRAVTGLVARQQCAGPLQLTVADVAVRPLTSTPVARPRSASSRSGCSTRRRWPG
jgi:phosphoribosylformylglycinamidine synthase